MNDYQFLSKFDAELIANDYFDSRSELTNAQEKPVAVLVAGQSGAGKTEAAVLVKTELREKGGYIHIDADRMREELPLANQMFPSEVTQPDAARLVGILRTRTIAEQRNFIEEGTFRDKETVDNMIDTLKSYGYKVEMVAVSTHSEQSLLGIYQRYEMQIAKGSKFPRLVSEDYHQLAFQGFTDMFETNVGKFDRVRIINRSGKILFDSVNKDNFQDAFTTLIQGREIKRDDLEILQRGWKRVNDMAIKRGEKDSSYLAQIKINKNRIDALHRVELHKPSQINQNSQEFEMGKLIIDNERDKRAAEWLIKNVGQKAVEKAIDQLAGNRKPYVSNVAKVLGLEIPKSVVITPAKEARENLSKIMKNIKF